MTEYLTRYSTTLDELTGMQGSLGVRSDVRHAVTGQVLPRNKPPQLQSLSRQRPRQFPHTHSCVLFLRSRLLLFSTLPLRCW